MAQKKKRPAAESAVAGPKGRLNSTSPSYHQNTEPDNAIWDACREALDTDAERKAQAAARLEAAATRLGFARNEAGVFERDYPHCGRGVALLRSRDGGVHVSATNVGPTCPAPPSLQQWLCDGGFQ
jgi:hypothetical protein